jgi:hypothetical protein
VAQNTNSLPARDNFIKSFSANAADSRYQDTINQMEIFMSKVDRLEKHAKRVEPLIEKLISMESNLETIAKLGNLMPKFAELERHCEKIDPLMNTTLQLSESLEKFKTETNKTLENNNKLMGKMGRTTGNSGQMIGDVAKDVEKMKADVKVASILHERVVKLEAGNVGSIVEKMSDKLDKVRKEMKDTSVVEEKARKHDKSTTDSTIKNLVKQVENVKGDLKGFSALHERIRLLEEGTLHAKVESMVDQINGINEKRADESNVIQEKIYKLEFNTHNAVENFSKGTKQLEEFRSNMVDVNALEARLTKLEGEEEMKMKLEPSILYLNDRLTEMENYKTTNDTRMSGLKHTLLKH